MANSGSTINFAGGGTIHWGDIVDVPPDTPPDWSEITSKPTTFPADMTTIVGREKYHGIDKSTFAYTFDQGAKEITIAAGSTYWIKGTSYTYTTETILSMATAYGSAFVDGSLYHVYFDTADGQIKVAQNIPVDLFSWAYLFAGFYNGTSFAITPEAHSHTRDIDWHVNAHMTIGARYHSGFDLVGYTVGNSGTINSTGGTLYDEDINHTFLANPTQTRYWYRTAAGKYTWRLNTYFHSGNATTVQNLNSTTFVLDTVASNRYVNMWVYIAGDDTTPWQTFIGETTYTTVALARAEATPTLNGFNLSPEMKLAYRLCYQGNGTLAELPQDFRRSSSLPSGYVPATTATQVTVIPVGSITATNTQLALEQLDSKSLYDAGTF